MTDENRALLQRYVAHKSEGAFAELVQRNINLVYSAALRQTGGGASIAEDITQAVFTDLAGKAPRLLKHASLTGWLYTCTRFLAAKARRSEQRRRAREHKAHIMNQALGGSGFDPAWDELRPILDDAMHDLSPADRETVLLRYFEGQRLAEIGTRLGVSENAARMRVERALDKLRAALARRGITSTAAAVGVMIAEHAVNAAPAGLSARVSRAAWDSCRLSSGLAAGFLALLPSFKIQLAAIGTVLALAGFGACILFFQTPKAGQTAMAISSEADQDAQSPKSMSDLSLVQIADPSDAQTANLTVKTNNLILEVVRADSGQPIPNAIIEAWIWPSKKGGAAKLHSSERGLCEVPLPAKGATRLVFASKVDGLADTRLEWRTDRGQAIPQRYTLRIANATPIGGRVVDADGNPVEGAQVGFNNGTDPAQEGTGPQTDNFGWPFWVTGKTDDQGRWRMDRVSADAISTLYGSATHSNHVGSEMVWLNKDPKTRQELLEGTHVFRLGWAVTVRGIVANPEGEPIPDASVLVGQVGTSGRRETKTGLDGTFLISGCKPGKNLLSASAKGFAPTTLDVELAADSEPFRLTLQRGNVLRLQVVNTSGKPVPKASVWLDTFNRGPISTQRQPPATQVQFNRKTDAQGRLEWDEAPSQELRFAISAPGYMRISDVLLRPDGTEHVITLPDALTISGTVRDASSGQLIPKFRIITGWPAGRTENTARWSGIDRFWLNFEGGKFKHVFEEPVVVGTTERSFIFKFEAEGYAPSVSRVVHAEEVHAEFDALLESAVSRLITVVLPDGRPAASADIGLVSPAAQINLLKGTLDRSQGADILRADGQGKFKLPSDPTITRVLAVHPNGFAQVPTETLADNSMIILQPWGQITGTYMSGDTPFPGASLLIQLNPPDHAVRCDFASYRVTTDSNGRFDFPQVPPGKLKLVRLVPQQQESVWMRKTLQDVEVLPGQITQITVQDTESPGQPSLGIAR